jgi:hypothetical protein
MRIALRLVEELGEAACYSAILESGQKKPQALDRLYDGDSVAPCLLLGRIARR